MTDQTIHDYLSQNAFFSGLSEDVLEVLARSASTRRISKGEVLFRQGERADKFYLVRDGRMSVEIPAIMGPVLEIQNLGPGEVLGWSWLIAPYRWNFQARAEEDAELLEFDGKALLARCEEEPEFGFQLLKRFAALMSERLDAARQRMMDEWNPAGFA